MLAPCGITASTPYSRGSTTRKRRGDHEPFAQRTVTVRDHEQTCDARIGRQPRHDFAIGRELVLRIERTEQMQKLIRVAHGFGRWRIDERKLVDRAQAQRFEPQQHARETRAQYLRLRVRGALREILLRVQSHAHARREPSAAAGALHGVRLRDRLHTEALHAVARTVPAHARESRVDHVADTRHRQRRLRDVRREHDARRLAGLEDPPLPRAREPRVERQHLVSLRAVTTERVLRVVDPAFAGQEHEHVAHGPVDALGRELARGGRHRRREILSSAARLIATSHRKASAGHAHDRRAVEVLREALGIDRRRCDDDLEVGPLPLDALQVPEDEIDVEAALVRFVDDQRVVGPQLAVRANLVQQYAVRHDLDAASSRPRASVNRTVSPTVSPRLHLELLGEPRRPAACAAMRRGCV